MKIPSNFNWNPLKFLKPTEGEGEKRRKTFSAFQGVFIPTTLTILGVIMYLRQPWVVGNAGILGAFAIVGLAVAITLFTALSMSSMTTNIRIGSGGAFSIISQSLGLEIGGSIGIPLYFSQACAVAMYVFGFREGWLSVFPEHSPILIDIATFAIVWLIGMVSTDFAFKIQYLILALVVGSIVSIVGGLFYVETPHQVEWIGSFKGEWNGAAFETTTFWVVFAIFFPAVTGIMAGANMSGDLTNPRKAIPEGTLIAVALTSLIYFALILVAAYLAPPEELVKNYNVFLDRAAWKPIVVVGLLGATFSSALSSFVGAPRILFALGEFSILPGSRYFTQKTKSGEPRNALIFTGLIVLFSLALRNLNAIAPLITMFFMITYAMINVVVLIEQSLGLPSFRPTFKVPIIIPLLGTVGCFFVMFIINPTVSIIAIAVIMTFYIVLVKRGVKAAKGDARSGLFTALAEWATKKSNELSPEKEARAWQPELLIPICDPKEIRGAYRLIYAIIHPKGSIKVLGLKLGDAQERLQTYLPTLMKTFREVNMPASYSFLDSRDFGHSVAISMQALGTAFFKPNTIFLKIMNDPSREDAYRRIIAACKEKRWALMMFLPNDDVGLGIEKVVNVWLDQIPEDWEEQLDLGNNDLILLLGLIIHRNWKAKLNLIKTVRKDVYDLETERLNVLRIKELARVPKNTAVTVIRRDLDMWNNVPQADLNIMALPDKDTIDFQILKTIPQKLRTSCVFTVDSGRENALV